MNETKIECKSVGAVEHYGPYAYCAHCGGSVEMVCPTDPNRKSFYRHKASR